jgi:hypothetical protein
MDVKLGITTLSGNFQEFQLTLLAKPMNFRLGMR